MDDADELGNRAEALQGEVAGLRQDVTRLGQRTDGLREDLGTLGDRTRRTEGNVRWIALVAAIAIGLAAAIGITAYRGAATDARVDAICPVLALVVGGYNPESRPAGPARDAYIRSFDIMRAAYIDTGCVNVSPPVPPRQDS